MPKNYSTIQFFRCLAILSVFAFHLWPNIFPSGFLGVDIFFILSGFLMTKIFFKIPSHETFGLNLVLNFYYRRIKRIIPGYLITILFVVIFGRFVMLQTDFDFLKIDAFYAIFFVSNYQSVFKQRNYFDMVSVFYRVFYSKKLGRNKTPD